METKTTSALSSYFLPYFSKRFFLVIALISVMLISAGCRNKEPRVIIKNEMVELTYYKMFDDEDVMIPLIQEYQSHNKNVRINYKTFSNLDEYYELIIDELAEGEGPDIFAAQNFWFLKNRRKISPAEADFVPPNDFRATFVDVAAKDLIWPNEEGEERVYAIPLTVDTLALYYNKDHFEDRLPQQGKPSSTWAGIREDVFRLSKQDDSFEKFQVAGAALGRSDNVSRAFDTLLVMILQEGVEIYNEDYSEINLGGTSGAQALALYTSFADERQKNYSWNLQMADPRSDAKELSAFARGKVSMIVGYSYLYEDIIRQIEIENAKGFGTISKSSVKISQIPQMEDPKVSSEKRITYASYFAETVSRTSEHPDVAWDFLLFLASKDNLQTYFDDTKKTTSRRDMIDEQKKHPTFGVFAEQIGFAESIPMTAYDQFEEILEKAIMSSVNGGSERDAIRVAESELQSLLPKDGLLPVNFVKNEGS